MNKTTRRWVLVIISAAILFYFGVYVWGTNSSAYRYLNSVVRSSPEIHRRVGDVSGVRLGIVGGYSENYSDQKTRAIMTLIVHGNRGEIAVKAKVEKNDGNWVILGAWIDGKKATLN